MAALARVFDIGFPVSNSLFGNLEPSRISGLPFQTEVLVKRTGLMTKIWQYPVITQRTTKTGEVWFAKDNQSERYLFARPTDGTSFYDEDTDTVVSGEGIQGLDYRVTKDGEKVALTIPDLEYKVAKSTAAHQAEQQANRVDVAQL